MSSDNAVTRSGVQRKLDQLFAAQLPPGQLPSIAPEENFDRWTIAGGRIRLIRRIGGGSFGDVYLAVDQSLGREVAVKIPRAHWILNSPMLDRFAIEAKSLARLDHPSIAKIYETGVTTSSNDSSQDIPYLVLEFCCGPDLATWLRLNVCDDLCEVVQFIRELTLGLDHAHQRGVIHGDVKPANVLMRPKFDGAKRLSDFHPMLTDFGLARLFDSSLELTGGSTIVGTPLYMSPEQAWGNIGDVGPASDQYSLASVWVQMMTGKSLHQAETYADLIDQFRSCTPPAIDCRLDGFGHDHLAVCQRALASLPEHRYATAGDFAADLQCLIGGTTPSSRQVKPWRRWWRRASAPHRLVEFCSVIEIIAAVRILYAGIGYELVAWTPGLTSAAERSESLALLLGIAVPYDVALILVTHRRSRRGLPGWLETATLISLIGWTILMSLSALHVVEASSFYERSAEARIAGLTLITLLFLAQTIAWIASRLAAARVRRRSR